MQAATLIQAGEVYHAARGTTYLGGLDGGLSQRTVRIAEIFNRCGIETKTSHNILGVMWSKMLINIGINGKTPCFSDCTVIIEPIVSRVGITALIYYDRSSGTTCYIHTAQAITIGITTGLIGSFGSLIIGWFVYLIYGHWDIRFIQSITEQMDEIPEYMADMLNELNAQEETGYNWISILFTNLIIFPIFCV
jgi:nitrate reductase NapE component